MTTIRTEPPKKKALKPGQTAAALFAHIPAGQINRIVAGEGPSSRLSSCPGGRSMALTVPGGPSLARYFKYFKPKTNFGLLPVISLSRPIEDLSAIIRQAKGCD